MTSEKRGTWGKVLVPVVAFLVAGAIGFGFSIFGPGPAVTVTLVGLMLLLVALRLVKPRRAWLILLSVGLIVGGAIYLGLGINVMLHQTPGEGSASGTATPIGTITPI